MESRLELTLSACHKTSPIPFISNMGVTSSNTSVYMYFHTEYKLTLEHQRKWWGSPLSVSAQWTPGNKAQNMHSLLVQSGTITRHLLPMPFYIHVQGYRNRLGRSSSLRTKVFSSHLSHARSTQSSWLGCVL